MKTSYISPKLYLNRGYYFNSKCTHPVIECNLFGRDDYIGSFSCYCLICRKTVRNTDVIESNPYVLKTAFNFYFDDKVIIHKYIESICNHFINHKEINIVEILHSLEPDIKISINELHAIIRSNIDNVKNITKNKILTK